MLLCISQGTLESTATSWQFQQTLCRNHLFSIWFSFFNRSSFLGFAHPQKLANVLQQSVWSDWRCHPCPYCHKGACFHGVFLKCWGAFSPKLSQILNTFYCCVLVNVVGSLNNLVYFYILWTWRDPVPFLSRELLLWEWTKCVGS